MKRTVVCRAAWSSVASAIRNKVRAASPPSVAAALCFCAICAMQAPAAAAMLTSTPVDIDGTQIGTISIWTNTDIPAGKQKFFGAGPATATGAADGSTYAEFTASANIATTAANFGYDHFNWLNFVRSGSQDSTPGDPRNRKNAVPFPFIDPLSGGNSGNNFSGNSPDDVIPYYWGEADPTKAEIAGNTVGNTLRYFDHPVGNIANASWNFTTYLVAVADKVNTTTGGKFRPVIGFDWTFTENATDDGQLAITGLDFEPTIPDLQAATLNSALQQPYDFPKWIAVPEPGSMGLLASLASIALVQRRQRRRAVQSSRLSA